MTANQIAYAKHLEESRHNRVSEVHEHQDVQTRKRAAETGWYSARETARHNVEQEKLNWWDKQTGHAETQRHNKEEERTKLFSANALRDFQINQSEALLRQAASSERQAQVSEENARTNALNARTRQNELAASIQAVNKNVGLGYSQLAESQRHNVKQEHTEVGKVLFPTVETIRHNQAVEEVSRRQADIAQQQADVAKRNATVNERNVAAREAEVETGKYNAKSQRITAVSGAASNTANAITRGMVALRGGGYIK